MEAIVAEALIRRFGHVEALRGVTFSIGIGQRVALLGRSGSGKSTLLHLLAGLDRPTSGRLTVFGQTLSALDSAGLARYRLHDVGIIFQTFHLLPTRSVWENVAMPLLLAGVPPSERQSRAREMLAAVGLTDRAKAFPPTLSGGEAQRVAIARALIARPRLLLADEPTGNLDSENAERVRQLLLEQVTKLGLTLVLVTHDASLAHQTAERILRLHDGQLVEEGIDAIGRSN
ncbi:MAG: ABC transporter ATP-binding protein [Gemmataceae bacterium]